MLCIPVRLWHETSKHYFSCSGGTSTDSTKKRAGTCHAELVFLHPVGSVGLQMHYSAFRA
jgi:hypothetical protein